MSTIKPTESSLSLQTASLSLENRQSKFSKFERLVQSVFSYLFEFFDAESIIHFQRGSNRQIFGQCSFALHHYLGKFKVFKYSDMHLIRAIRPHPRFWGDTQGNFLISREQINNFGHLFKATPNVVFLDFSKLPKKNYLMKIAPYFKELQKLSGISFAESSLKVNQVCEILKSEGLQELTSLDVSSTDFSDIDNSYTNFAECIANRFPKLEHLNLNHIANHNLSLPGMMAITETCQNLRSLRISDYAISDPIAWRLSKCILLTELDMCIGYYRRSPIETIFESCKNITSLNLFCGCMEEEGLEIIGKECENLKILNIGYLSKVLNLKKLARCTNLQEIYVTTTDKIDDLVIESLKMSFSTLRKFYIYERVSMNVVYTPQCHYILNR